MPDIEDLTASERQALVTLLVNHEQNQADPRGTPIVVRASNRHARCSVPHGSARSLARKGLAKVALWEPQVRPTDVGLAMARTIRDDEEARHV